MFDLPGTFLGICSLEVLLDLENETYVVFFLICRQGPASSLEGPAILLLDNWSTGIKLQHLTLGVGTGGPSYLLS